MKPGSPCVITLNCVLIVVWSAVKIHYFCPSIFTSLTAKVPNMPGSNQTHPFVKMKLDIGSFKN